jgi:hypothetical protein
VKLTRTVVAVAIAVAAIAQAGCSGDDDGKDKGVKKDDPTAGQVISPDDMPAIPVVKRPQGIIADTKMDACSTEPGKVEANGTVKNSSKKPRDLAVVVSWTSGSGGDVVGRGVATFKSVPGGDTKKWSVEATVKADAAVQCVVTAQAGTLK